MAEAISSVISRLRTKSLNRDDIQHWELWTVVGGDITPAFRPRAVVLVGGTAIKFQTVAGQELSLPEVTLTLDLGVVHKLGPIHSLTKVGTTATTVLLGG